MSSYILYDNGVLEKDGNTTIAVDELNPDYKDYLAWLALGNQPTAQPGSVYLAKIADDKTARQQFKDVYQTMIARLDQIQNAGTVPFTQAGFNALVQANKDQALFIERIMKAIAKLL